jgi:hypothetical protein
MIRLTGMREIAALQVGQPARGGRFSGPAWPLEIAPCVNCGVTGQSRRWETYASSPLERIRGPRDTRYGSCAQMPIVPHTAILAPGSHDQAHTTA